MVTLIENSIDSPEMILLLAGFISMALFFFLLYWLKKKEVIVTKRYVDMGLHFYDEDERFLSVKDEKLRYFLINEAYTKIFGRKKEDFIGKRDEDVFEEDLAKRLREVDQAVLEKQEKIVIELTWDERRYRMRKFPLILPNGKKGVGAYTEDITDAVRRREERERIIRRNEILLDVVSRDFRSSHEQLDYVLKKALVLTESTYGYIYLYNETDKTFILENFARNGVVTSSRREAQQIYRLDKMGLWGESVRTGKPMIYNGEEDISHEELLHGASAFHMMTVPVIMEEKILAVVGVANNPYGYQITDAEDLSLLMTGVWHAKERREYIVELRKTNRSLAETKEKLTLILNSSAEGIYGMDTNGNFTFINESALTLFGYTDVKEVIGKSCHELIHYRSSEGLPVPKEECRIYHAIDRGEIITEEDEVFCRIDDTCFPVRYSAHPQILNGEIIGSVVTFSDITERKKQEEEVLYLSYHDALTGLYNRAYLESISQDLENEKNLPLSVVVGDVNGLKLSNDIFGHKKGDDFLKRISRIIEDSTRKEDLLFRVGGDEFYLFLKNTEEEKARSIMQRIAHSIQKEDFHGIQGGISLGLSVRIDGSIDIGDVMNDAEQKMYREKTLNKSRESARQLKAFIDILMKKEEERLHAENTMKIAQEIGNAISLSREVMTKLKDAAYVHDIGKITKIVNREEEQPLCITREEHAVIGYRILNSFEQTMDLAGIVLSHHEKWDGSGYPKGLKGEEIPLLSRIISVAERFDRLTSVLSETPLSVENAISVMKEESGRILDEKLVDALAEIIRHRDADY